MFALIVSLYLEDSRAGDAGVSVITVFAVARFTDRGTLPRADDCCCFVNSPRTCPSGVSETAGLAVCNLASLDVGCMYFEVSVLFEVSRRVVGVVCVFFFFFGRLVVT